MQVEKQVSPGMQQVADLVEKIQTGMLTTEDKAGLLVSRPMQALHMDADGSIWFFTNARSAKSQQLQRVNLSFVNKDDSDYLSLTGSAELLSDRAKIDQLWSTMAKPWFPAGKDDPDLALLRVAVKTAEVWDATDSTMVRLLAMAAAATTGQPNAVLQGDHTLINNSAGRTTH